MNCSQRRDLMPEFVLGLLPADEAAELRTHLLGGCPRCTAARVEAEEMLALLPTVLPTAAPPSAVRGRLLERIAAMPRPGAAAPSAPLRAPSASWGWLLAMAASVAIAIGITTAVTSHRYHQHLSELQQDLNALSTSLASAETQIAEVSGSLLASNQRLTQDNLTLGKQLASAQETIGMLRATNLRLVEMTSSGPAPATARARALWDRDTQHWQLITTGLTPTPPNRYYELWFITGSQKTQKAIPAGIFRVDARGDGVLTVPVPADIGAISVCAVTDEPGLMTVPTGAKFLVGTL